MMKLPRHNMTGSKTHNSWIQMNRRCRDKTINGFHNYGGRGIKVCKGFKNFIEFYRILGKCPENHSIDRINNNLNYTCGECLECLENNWTLNCKWSNPTEQTRNRKNTIIVKYKGVEKPLKQWCEELNLPYNRIRARFYKGMSIDEIFEMPYKNEAIIEYGGEKLPLKEWAKRLNIGIGALYNRLFIYGWGVEKSLTAPLVK